MKLDSGHYNMYYGNYTIHSLYMKKYSWISIKKINENKSNN